MFVSFTYVYYVFVYFVLYVYNCIHERTIKYLVSCILYLDKSVKAFLYVTFVIPTKSSSMYCVDYKTRIDEFTW